MGEAWDGGTGAFIIALASAFSAGVSFFVSCFFPWTGGGGDITASYRRLLCFAFFVCCWFCLAALISGYGYGQEQEDRQMDGRQWRDCGEMVRED